MVIEQRKISPTSNWAVAVGALFGAITLIGLFIFAYLAGESDGQFVCKSFQILAAVFSLGAALSAVFLGGAAGAQGKTDSDFSVSFGVGGGVAVLLIMFIVFSQFQPTCSNPGALAEIRNLVDKSSSLIDDMAGQLSEGARLAQGSADNYSDSKTCAKHGGEAKGFILAADASRKAAKSNLSRALELLDKKP